MKKSKIVWIVLFSVLGAMTLGSLIGLKFFVEFKYAVYSMVIASSIALAVFLILRLKRYKKDLEEDMPIYLAELLNAGIITREQCLNPGKKEREMFLGEYMSEIRRKRFFIAVCFFVAAYGVSLFFFF